MGTILVTGSMPFAGLPDKWISMYQGEYQALLDNLRKQKAA